MSRLPSQHVSLALALQTEPQIIGSRFERAYDAFRRTAAMLPEHAAVEAGGRAITYRQLNEEVAGKIDRLHQQGIGVGDVAAVTGVPGTARVANMLAVLGSGAVLLTVDPDVPPGRVEFMLRHAGARALLEDSGVRQLPDEWRRIRIEAIDAAYIFFTSGTTGAPKAVLGTHNGLGHFLDWQRRTFGIGPGDRCAQLIALSFDPILRDVLLPLTSGATLCVPDAEHGAKSGRVIPWLASTGATVVHTVPSLMRRWLAMHHAGAATLRWLFSAGEPLTGALVNRWRASVSAACRVVNLYGPTETTLAKCWYEVPAECGPGPLPIGVPLPETEVLLLRADRSCCAVGEEGELAIRTPHRTLGYFDAQDEQKKRFVVNPVTRDEQDIVYLTGDRGRIRTDGLLEINGRVDDELKVRGVRVNPREIEAALEQHEAIREAAAYVETAADGEPMLVAVVTCDPRRSVDPAELSRLVLSLLPSALVPSSVVSVDRIPLTVNGKVDRAALPEAAGRGRRLTIDYEPPQTETERMVAALWSKVLRIPSIGATEDFFGAGGDSLQAMQLVAAIDARLNAKIPVAALLRAATVRGVAAMIDAQRAVASRSPLVLIQRGSEPAIFCVHPIGGEVLCYRSLADLLGNRQTVYGLQANVDEIERDEPTVEDLAAGYVRAIRSVQAHGPYRLIGFSLGGLIAFEMARQLAVDNSQTELLVVVDTHAPGSMQRKRISVRTAADAVRSAAFFIWDDLRTIDIQKNALRLVRKLRLLKIRALQGRTAVLGADGFTGVSDEVLDLRFPGYRAPLVRALGRAARRYKPAVYNGSVVLIRARAQPLFQAELPEAGWRRLARHVDVALVRGSHFRVLQDVRTVESLARHIRARLAPAVSRTN